jgi:hypothetical protein
MTDTTQRPIVVCAMLLLASVASAEESRPSHLYTGGYEFMWDSETDRNSGSGILPTGYFVGWSERTRWRWDFTVEFSKGTGTRNLLGFFEYEEANGGIALGPTFHFRNGARTEPYVRVLGVLVEWLPPVPYIQVGTGVDAYVSEHVGLRFGGDVLWRASFQVGPIVRWGR